VKPFDADGFAAAIRLFDQDRKALSAARRRAAAFTSDNFSWDAVAQRYVAVLEGLASASR
jgi:glycosyltransferase involved in cell wall biosynthesis